MPVLALEPGDVTAAGTAEGVLGHPVLDERPGSGADVDGIEVEELLPEHRVLFVGLFRHADHVTASRHERCTRERLVA